MSALTLRLVKGSPLTNTELDNNFTALNNDKLESATAASTYQTIAGMSSYLPLSGGTLTGPSAVSVNSSGDALRITQVGAGNALVVEDSANPDATPFAVNSVGQVFVGANANYNSAGGRTPILQVNGTDYAFGAASVTRWSADNSSFYFGINKSRGATAGTHTAVQSGDALGALEFTGSDGTGFIPAAGIYVNIDGTPGTNDMPGRLVFSTTADGASSPTERMRIDNAGRVGIGGTASAIARLQVTGTLPSSGAFTYGISAAGTIPSTTTSGYVGFDSAATTQATAFTLSNYSHFQAFSNLGAGSTVTNQYGFSATASLTGATNNYGFYGNIASGTGRYNFYAAGTADNYFAGNVGIGTTSLNPIGTSTNLAMYGSASTSISFRAGAGTGGYISTDGVNYFQFMGLAATSATVLGSNNTTRLSIASTGTISLGAAPGSESLRVTPVASAVNYWNAYGNSTGNPTLFYADGSDANVTAQFSTKGTGAHSFTTNGLGSPAQQFRIAHTASAVNYLQVSGSATNAGVLLGSQGSDANVNINYWSKGNSAHIFATGSSYTQQFLVQHTASAVNYLQVTGGTTGNAAAMRANGSDTNIAVDIFSKGSGSIALRTDRDGAAPTQFLVAHTASAVNYLQVTGGATGGGTVFSSQGSDTNIPIDYRVKGASYHIFTTNSGNNAQFLIQNTASAVNYLQVTGAATGGAAALSAQGSDANISINCIAKGTGGINFYTNSSVNVMSLGHTASAVNYALVYGSATGNAVSYGVAGSDTNVDLKLQPKGTGKLVVPGTAYSPEITLTDGATVNWDASTGQVAKLTLGGNRTIAAPTNLATGAFYSLNLIQDATGSRTVTWNSVFAFTGGTAPTLSTAASSVDQICFRYDGTKLREVGRSLGAA